jgi:hypothetical protein
VLFMLLRPQGLLPGARSRPADVTGSLIDSEVRNASR